VDGADLRMNNKSIIGSALLNWWPKLLNEEKLKYKQYIVDNLSLFRSKIKKSYKFEDYKEALEDLNKNGGSNGKILLKF